MHINLNINTAEISETDKRILAAIAHCTYAPDDIEQPQPEVGDNTGTSSTGIILSPGAAGVSEGAGATATASAGQQATPSAPETSAPPAEKRTRKPKETAAVHAGEPAGTATATAGSTPNPTSALADAKQESAGGANGATSAAPDAKPLTIDDVRAKLQALTGAKGIDAGLALLGEFKAGRISELKAEDYPAFVAKCEVAA